MKSPFIVPPTESALGKVIVLERTTVPVAGVLFGRFAEPVPLVVAAERLALEALLKFQLSAAMSPE
ncbi:Uncharacterised protein [uncultured archaeon]|nr:Uncharacterised protein [uncultured archaeon]